MFHSTSEIPKQLLRRQGVPYEDRRHHRGIGHESTIEYYRGGMELPLILRDARDVGIPFLDTTKLHVERIVEELLS